MPLFQSDYCSVDRLGSNVIVYTRTSVSFASIEALRADYSGAVRALEAVATNNMGILVDLRLAPGRNDPEFEQAHGEPRVMLLRAFRAAAIVVSTSVGKLQVRRYLEQDGIAAEVCGSIEDATSWLGRQL